MASGSWNVVPPQFWNSPFGATSYPYVNLSAEDLETIDAKNVQAIVDNYMKDTYPDFEPEIVYGNEKEYYLPALKVLLHDGEVFLSPSIREEWKDGELRARCNPQVNYKHAILGIGYHHGDVPDEECDCGIYGSVNLDEVSSYLHNDYAPFLRRVWSAPDPWSDVEYSTSFTKVETRPVRVVPVLCIIEPAPDAKTILCRKGWRTSHSFISEIVGDTISIDDTSTLLSIAWKRDIDVRRIYENR